MTDRGNVNKGYESNLMSVYQKENKRKKTLDVRKENKKYLCMDILMKIWIQMKQVSMNNRSKLSQFSYCNYLVIKNIKISKQYMTNKSNKCLTRFWIRSRNQTNKTDKIQ